MEESLLEILDISKKYYVENILDESEYKDSVISVLKSLILKYNMHMQLETNNITNKFISKIKKNVYIDKSNNSNISNKDRIPLNKPEMSKILPEYIKGRSFKDDNMISLGYKDNILRKESNSLLGSDMKDNIETNNLLYNNSNIYDLEALRNDIYDLENNKLYDESNIINIKSYDNTINSNNNSIYDIMSEKSNKELYDISCMNSVNSEIIIDSEEENKEYLFNDYQCCARIGEKKYNLDCLPSEFIDRYPCNVYITEKGEIIGDSCNNIVENFNSKTNYLCEKHLGYEDIRDIHNIN